MKVSGETMIFTNDKGYSTTISNKKEDGTYENMFIAVNFRKGVSVDNKTKINITNGFLSFYKTKEGLPKPKIMIMDFETIGETSQVEDNPYQITSDDDLPF